MVVRPHPFSMFPILHPIPGLWLYLVLIQLWWLGGRDSGNDFGCFLVSYIRAACNYPTRNANLKSCISDIRLQISVDQSPLDVQHPKSCVQCTKIINKTVNCDVNRRIKANWCHLHKKDLCSVVSTILEDQVIAPLTYLYMALQIF